MRRSKEADAEVYHQLYMTLHNAGSDPYLGAMEQAKAIISERDEAVALIDEVDTLAVNNVTGCGTCSTIQNITTAFLAKVKP